MLVFDWPAAIRIKTACTDCIWDFALRLSAILPRYGQGFSFYKRLQGETGIVSSSVNYPSHSGCLGPVKFFSLAVVNGIISLVSKQIVMKRHWGKFWKSWLSLVMRKFQEHLYANWTWYTCLCNNTIQHRAVILDQNRLVSALCSSQTCRFAVICRILPAQIGGGQEGPKVKPTLLLLRQIYVWSLHSTCLDCLATRVTGIGTKHKGESG